MIKLVRDNIKSNIISAKSFHAGLKLQKGLVEIPNNSEANNDQGESKKSSHIDDICRITWEERYERSFNRWLNIVKGDSFFCKAFKLESRLFIGTSGQNIMETSCAINHCHGMPYIPGSSVKGVIRSWAEKELSNKHAHVIDQLLGSSQEDSGLDLGSLVNIYDAWWIPGEEKPFTKEIVNSHHQDYYNQKDGILPSDFDSPIPNFMLAVEGSFLFSMRGKKEQCKVILELLSKALYEIGIGAKNVAGYGYMEPDDKWNIENLTTGQHKIKLEVEKIPESDLAIMFTRDLKKTKGKYKNFDLLVDEVITQHKKTIESWKDLPKETNKNKNKAYKFFKKNYLK